MRLAISCWLLFSISSFAEETSLTLIGPANPDLEAGADALRAGNAREGVKLTESGLKMASGRRERIAGLANLCAGYLLLDELPTAEANCDAVLDIAPNHWRSLSNRALLRIEQQRYEQAAADLAAARAIAPGAAVLDAVESRLLDATDPVQATVTIDDGSSPARRD